MKRIRYLTLLWMLFCGILCKAQFNPVSPEEPGQLTTKLTLKANPSGAGSTSGAGSFVSGTSVTVTASANSSWQFVNWTNASGVVVSTSSAYTFVKGERNETLTANFSFNPVGPSEPDELPHKLTLIAGNGGSVSGSGYYLNGTAAGIRASTSAYFEFDGWYMTDGTCYSKEASTTYTMGDKAVTLTARFTFNPSSPTEPGEVNLWRLKLTAQDGGRVSADKYYLKEGETTNVKASANSGYIFAGWYQGEDKISSKSDFGYTMGAENTSLEAKFVFSPEAPNEPDYIQQRKFSFMLKNIITKPGMSFEFPILLTPLATLGDITFQLNFDPKLNVDIDNVVVGETSSPYQLQREAITSGDTYDEGFTSYRFTLTGGNMVVGENDMPTVTPILTFPVSIASDIETATSYKITINQISVTNPEDGTTQSAGTRNGRISVYKNGDANGDNNVSIIDAVLVVDYILGNPAENFIEEAANVNNDTGISIMDAVGVVDIILGERNGSRSTQRMSNNTVIPD